MKAFRLLAAALVLFAPVLHAVDSALIFDGAGDFVEVPNFQNLGITSEVTVEFWAHTGVAAQQSAFMLSPDNGNNRFQAHISYFNGNTYWDCGDITTTGRLFTPNPAGTVGNWTHYAFVASQSAATGKMRIYVNGVQVASKDTMDSWDAASSVLRIGGSTGNFFQGALDDFRVWNLARSQDEIRRTMIGPLTGGEAGLRLYFKFDDATGTTAVNSATATGAAFNGTLNGDSLWSTPALRTYTVANANDSGDGSLRQAFTDAAAAFGPALITFAPALSGQTITLSSEIAVGDTAGVAVDASSLPGGITVSGGGANRLFYLDSGTLATFRAATFTGGNGVGAFDSGRGGAIYSNNATLTLDRCTLNGNSAPGGAGDGGAIFANFGTVSLTNCTLAANNAGSRGGAIFNKGTLTLTHCTVAGNSATGPGFGEGGGIHNEFVACTLQNSIVSGNTVDSTFGTQILQNGGTLTSTGANLVAIDNAKDIHGGATVVGTFNNAPPNLAALAANGGPTQTMLPNATSPAIDAAVGSTAATDQRGLSRPQGGTADIGAVETVPASGLVVQNNADSGPGSLRQAIAEAAISPGADTITFASGLSGQTILLTTGHLTLGSDVTIDATALTGGITISGNSDGDNVLEPGESRLFDIPAGVTVVLRRLTLINGMAVGGLGGAIVSDGQLTVDQCAISASRASLGGGIYNFGTLTLTQSTLSGNSASDDGGGIFGYTGMVTLRRSIVAGNTANVDANIFGSISSGTNNLTSGDPLLAPLGNYGGPTQTMPPLPGSPALDAGGSTTDTTDQRGLTRVVDADGNGTATVDIGAVELQVRLVTTTADENDGLGVNGVSLREAVADTSGGSDIIRFDSSLNGQTLTLGGTHLSLARGPLLIDGSTLPGGITLSGGSNGDNVLDPGESRLFDIPAGVTVVLRKLTLINGMAGVGFGGAIQNSGQLTVDQCAISACRAFSGGGIYNNGTLSLTQSTLSGNTASGNGGGIYNTGTVTLTQSTLSGNSVSAQGGGIFNVSTLSLNRSIVAGNTALSSGNIFGSISGSDNLTSGDPLLAPLGNYGGPTQTMPPLPGSPALDAGGSTTSPFSTDQRGAVRVADGDGNGSALVDIGAVEAIPALVTSTADSGAGSLRTALAAPSTDIVLFDPSLSGQTITLTSGQLTLSRGVAIDASALAAGLTVSGGSDGDATLEAGESRLFDILAGVSVVLRGLHLTNGIADPASNSATGEGGAIRNSGQLTLDLCAISACRSRRGGAINSTGVLTARRSTFQQNTATFGGAIHSADNGLLTVADSTFLMNTAGDRGGAVLENDVDSPAGHPTLTRCTFHGNNAARGGAVYSFGLTNLFHCTLSANSASNVGGGVQASNTSVVTLTNCLVAGNSNGSSPDLGFDGGGVLTTSGVNLVGDLTGSGLSAGPTLLTGDPLLAPIADYGGPTQTRSLLPGSVARDAAFVLTPAQTTDQRGFPIVGTPDLGAAEAQIGAIAPSISPEDTATAVIPFTVGTIGTLSASSSVPSLVSSFDFGGSGLNRTLTVTPSADANGSAIVTVTDGLTGDAQTFQLTVAAVNDAPSFAKGANQSVPGNAGTVSIPGWATSISAGPPDESGQALTFNVTNNSNAALFATQPALAADGTLTFTPAGSVGTATLTITLSDDGGSTAPDLSTSAPQTFDIQITLAPFTVMNLADTGPGSLRAQIAAAAAQAGPDSIEFAAASSGGSITLSSEIVITDGAGLTIDASSLAGGLTIDGGPGTNRIFTVAAGSTAALKNLTLTGGDGGGATTSGQGGAILNLGALTLTGCTVSGNSAPSGFGGGIRNEATLTGIRSTISGNTSMNEGGGIMNAGAAANLQLTHCTVTANEATTRGGGIRNASGTMSASFTIVAGNTRGGSLNHVEANLVGTLGGTTNLVTGAPALAALGAYGGPTKTHALLATSPARNAATGSPATADQRGFPIVGVPDIGAYEAGTLNSFGAFAAETPGSALSPTGDADSDGRSDLLEYATQSDPHASNPGEIIPATYDHSVTGAITQANVTFPTRVGATDMIYTLQRSTTLTGGWATVAIWNATTGVLSQASGVSASRNPSTGLVSVADANVSGANRAFYRLNVTQP